MCGSRLVQLQELHKAVVHREKPCVHFAMPNLGVLRLNLVYLTCKDSIQGGVPPF